MCDTSRWVESSFSLRRRLAKFLKLNLKVTARFSGLTSPASPLISLCLPLFSGPFFYLSLSFFSAYLDLCISGLLNIYQLFPIFYADHHLCISILWFYLLSSSICFLPLLLHFCISFLSNRLTLLLYMQEWAFPISGFSAIHRLEIILPECMCPGVPKRCDNKIEALLNRGSTFIWPFPLAELN